MSAKHPIIAVTGSSGAGTTTTTKSFKHIFRQLGIEAALVEGDSFHRYTRAEMELAIRKGREENHSISYFGPEANDFPALASLFDRYGSSGEGEVRRYLHTFDEAVPFNQMPGTFTPFQPLPENTDLLYYEGLHGGVVTDDANVAEKVDLLIGMVPIVNLEWIQKIIRDTGDRGHSREKVMGSIVRSMDDYVNHMTPQFSRTHINFQRVPTVDTSNPFSAKDIPSDDESFVVIRFRGVKDVDFSYYLQMIQGSFMSRINTLVVPGGKMGLAMELILTPVIKKLIQQRKQTLITEQFEMGVGNGEQ
ncbi:phosphoribulokinase [Ferrimonas sediminum]|uniref:Phosphoribulokinase n=1 Tax=Ferrimonas sediminum TaxID=718193 RepID=A0A1G8V3A1_9GAMM|nr:phosphoribulokinase [Ferrimonas sediminum]SDJ60558.1 phosphoribulokinase [Ferrimonas sediminum]